MYLSRTLSSPNSKRKANAGFTLTEGIIAVILMGILLGIGLPVALKIRSQGIENAKAANASRLTALASAAMQADATVAAGASNNIDTTSGTTAVTSLNTGFTIGGITFKMNPTVGTPASYTVTSTATSISFGFAAGSTNLP